MSKLRLIGYARVSTTRQANYGVSLSAQERQIRAYASFVDAEIVDIEIDRGFSGRRIDRPAMKRAINKVVAGEADALIVYAIDRLARSTVGVLKTISELQKADRGFVSCREQLDSTTPHGRFTLTILAAMAQMESELISERVTESIAQRRAEGKALNQGSYGYTRDEDNKLVEVPEQMKVAERIVGLRDFGHTYDRICDRLNAAGIPAPRGRIWHKSSVRSVEMTYRRARGEDQRLWTRKRSGRTG